MKYIKKYEKTNYDWQIYDYFKASCRYWENKKYFTPSEINIFANHLASRFGISCKDALYCIKTYYSISSSNDDNMLLAAIDNNWNDIEEFLDEDADINYQDKNGDTLLILLAKYGSEDNIKKAISKGADMYIKNKDGKDFYDNAKECIKSFIRLEYTLFWDIKKYNL
jgi:ankyrin repeat protein